MIIKKCMPKRHAFEKKMSIKKVDINQLKYDGF